MTGGVLHTGDGGSSDRRVLHTGDGGSSDSRELLIQEFNEWCSRLRGVGVHLNYVWVWEQ